MIYVRYRNTPSPVEIQLNPQHNITTLSGQRLAVNRITRANVIDLKWQSDLEKHFDSLVSVSGPDWNAIQPFAKLIYPDAKVATAPKEIDIQIESFFKHLKTQLPILKMSIEGLNNLAKTLNDQISQTDDLLFKKYEGLYSSADLDIFSEKIKPISGDLPKFKESFDRLCALSGLSSKTHQVIDVYRQVTAADVGESEELRTQKELLLPRFALNSMIGNPTLAAAIISDGEKYIIKFNNAKEIHGKRAIEDLKKIKEKLDTCADLLLGLGNLNKLEMLGPPQGHELVDQLDKINQEVEAEISGRSKRHEELSYMAPKSEAENIEQRINAAFDSRIRILRNQLEKAIQGNEKDDNIKTLLRLMQITKLTEIARDLSPAMLETIKRILEKAQIQVVRSYAFDRIIQKYAAIGEEDLDKLLIEMKRLLEQDFKDKSRRGKKVILSFK